MGDGSVSGITRRLQFAEKGVSDLYPVSTLAQLDSLPRLSACQAFSDYHNWRRTDARLGFHAETCEFPMQTTLLGLVYEWTVVAQYIANLGLPAAADAD